MLVRGAGKLEGQSDSVVEIASCNAGKVSSTRKSNGGKPGAVKKCPDLDVGKTVRKSDMGKPCAAIECPEANGSQAVRKDEVGKPGAALECKGFNSGKVVREI